MDLWLLGFSFVFGFDPVLVWVFLCVLMSPLGFVRFSLVVKVKGSGLWVLGISGEFGLVFVGIS